MAVSVAGGQPKKHTNPSYKATKHFERTFLISDYYKYILLVLFSKRYWYRKCCRNNDYVSNNEILLGL